MKELKRVLRRQLKCICVGRLVLLTGRRAHLGHQRANMKAGKPLVVNWRTRRHISTVSSWGHLKEEDSLAGKARAIQRRTTARHMLTAWRIWCLCGEREKGGRIGRSSAKWSQLLKLPFRVSPRADMRRVLLLLLRLQSRQETAATFRHCLAHYHCLLKVVLVLPEHTLCFLIYYAKMAVVPLSDSHPVPLLRCGVGPPGATISQPTISYFLTFSRHRPYNRQVYPLSPHCTPRNKETRGDEEQKLQVNNFSMLEGHSKGGGSQRLCTFHSVLLSGQAQVRSFWRQKCCDTWAEADVGSTSAGLQNTHAKNY